MEQTSHNPQSITSRQNRILLGQALAILVCPAPNGKLFAVTVDRKDLRAVCARGFWRVRNVMGKKGFRLYCTTGNGRHNAGFTYLHRFLMNPGPHDLVDHRNDRSLDNRRENLRIASKSLNALNAVFARNAGRYGRGVVKIHKSGRFMARVRAGGKTRNLGTYATPALASQAVGRFLESIGACHSAATINAENGATA